MHSVCLFLWMSSQQCPVTSGAASSSTPRTPPWQYQRKLGSILSKFLQPFTKSPLSPPCWNGDQRREHSAVSPACKESCFSTCRPPATDSRILSVCGGQGYPMESPARPQRRITMQTTGMWEQIYVLLDILFSSFEKVPGVLLILVEN